MPPLTFEPLGEDPLGPLGDPSRPLGPEGDALGLLGPEGDDPLAGFVTGFGHGQGTYVTGAQASKEGGGGLETLLQIAGLLPLDLPSGLRETLLDPVAFGPGEAPFGPGEAPLGPRGVAFDTPATGLLPFDPPEGAVPFDPPEGAVPLGDPPSTGFPPV